MAAVPPQIPGLVGWRPLARGGFATVWEAKQLSLNRLVAVKVDRRTLETDAEQRRFLREAGAAGRMSGHPGIVTVHDAGILTDDRPYLVMALCEGGSLTKWVKGEPRPSQEEVREVGVRIADALAATHERGVLHRDVKPANILIDSYGQVGLADFGLAALPDPGMELSETLEAITPAYAPPEVFHRRPPTAAGDVYSLGATLYAVLGGRPPHWPEDGTPNVVDVFERLEDPIERIPDVDDELMDTLLAAMAHDPDDRPTAAEFRDRLQALTLGAPATNGKAVNGHAAASPIGPAEASAVAAVGPGTDQPAAGAAGRPGTEVPAGSGPAPAGGGQEPPELLVDDHHTDDRHRSRRRTGILVAIIVVVLAIALGPALANLLPDRGSVAPDGSSVTSAPAPSAAVSTGAAPSASPPQASPSPVPSASLGTLPAGAVDCSELGKNVYCVTQPECWGNVRSYAGATRLADPLDCYDLHVYQTFAVGFLPFIPRRQAEMDGVPEVEKACRRIIVQTMLVDPSLRNIEWEVIDLPPQYENETFFRCIFGKGERTSPIALRKP